MAIMLPILIIILIGLVELGLILYEQIAVDQAAREGARFAAAGGEDVDVARLGTEVIWHTLRFGSYEEAASRRNVFIAHGKIGDDGRFDVTVTDESAPAYWHPYMTGTYTVTTVTPSFLESELPVGAEVVVVQVFFDHHPLLGLPAVADWANTMLSAYTVMRMEAVGVRSQGCVVYPLAVRSDLGLVQPVKWRHDLLFSQMVEDPPLSVSAYVNPRDGTDTVLNRGDWVLEGEIDDLPVLEGLHGRYIRVPVWDVVDTSPVTPVYHVVGFAVVEPCWSDGELSVQLIRWVSESECR